MLAAGEVGIQVAAWLHDEPAGSSLVDVAEVGDVKELRGLLTALRNIEAVFDAYRVTPS